MKQKFLKVSNRKMWQPTKKVIFAIYVPNACKIGNSQIRYS
ncbi:MAG: hypothetical protein ACPG5B_06300 [Chitinophagales bacterium]